MCNNHASVHTYRIHSKRSAPVVALVVDLVSAPTYLLIVYSVDPTNSVHCTCTGHSCVDSQHGTCIHCSVRSAYIVHCATSALLLVFKCTAFAKCRARHDARSVNTVHKLTGLLHIQFHNALELCSYNIHSTCSGHQRLKSQIYLQVQRVPVIALIVYTVSAHSSVCFTYRLNRI